MTWAGKRQLMYLLLVVLVGGGLLFLIIYPRVHVTPSCMDQKKNGDERGVDCGGSCSLVCADDAAPLNVIWSRAFAVVPGRYNAVAYVENTNVSVGIRKLSYEFNLVDENNVSITKRQGVAYVMPGARSAIFEPAFSTGSRIPRSAQFTILGTELWEKIPEGYPSTQISVPEDPFLENETVSPRLSATVANNSYFNIKNADVVAILYDASGNAIAASQTHLEEFDRNSSTKVFFSWPQPFSAGVVKKEILVRFDPFTLSL